PRGTVATGWITTPEDRISRRKGRPLTPAKERPAMASLPLFDRLDEESALCSVSELTAQIKETLESDFADVAVCGEVSNLSRPRSGHVYLSLKDESSQIRAVIWKGAAQRLAFELADGLSVRVWGDLAAYARRGER